MLINVYPYSPFTQWSHVETERRVLKTYEQVG